MSIVMPKPDAATLDRRAEIVAALRAIVPGEGVIVDAASLRPDDFDGLTGDTSDNDEACTLAGIAAAGLKARG